jgi:putative ABC transport system ATP-binding protein
MTLTQRHAVRCRGLIKTYGAGLSAVRALRGVDLEVREGEFLMLVGPSGGGKTTLISILSGLLDQDDGDCEVLGRDVHLMAESERARFRGRSIGFVCQGFNLLPALTASENVAVPLLIQRQPRKLALEKAARMLELVHLGDRTDALPGQLSGGQQQRVAIARALIHEPPLIVSDEPTSNLDHNTGHEMMLVLHELGRQMQRSVIVVTHDTRILEFADRVARMEDGKIVSIGSAREAEQVL